MHGTDHKHIALQICSSYKNLQHNIMNSIKAHMTLLHFHNIFHEILHLRY